MPRIEVDRPEQVDDLTETSPEDFDRMAFAARATALIRPRDMRVAICEGSRRVYVEVGRQWGRSPSSRWAVLHVPLTASRRAIATAVLALYGHGYDRQAEEALGPYRGVRAWALDTLISELGRV